MIRMVAMFSAGLFWVVAAAAAEGSCFHTMNEAVRGAGVADVAGYRVESVTRDVVGGASWARVRSCGHPDWPVRLVGTAGIETRPTKSGAGAPEAMEFKLVVRAGSAVRVVAVGETVRMEVAGIAVEGGAMGQRVRVRVGSDGGERFVTGLVTSADVLEMVR